MTCALYPGSFDPIHLGHMSVVSIAASMFDRVVVAVIGNPAKRSGLFTRDERVDLVRMATSTLANVEVIPFGGLTVDAAHSCGADAIVRAAHKDRSDELTMAATNERVAGVKTTFVAADPALRHLSSTLVRSLIDEERLAEALALVPPAVAEALTAGAAPAR